MRIRDLTGSALGDSAGITGYGIGAIVAWIWFPNRALLIAGAAVTVAGAAMVIGTLRRGRTWHEQDVLTRKLFKAVRRIPAGYVLTDETSGELLTVERERGWLTLAVSDPPLPGSDAIVTRYMVGQYAAPNPPPLYKHQAALDDVPPARWRGRQRWQLEHLNRQAGGLALTADELAALLDQVRRSAAFA